jgi:hypothetical protein
MTSSHPTPAPCQWFDRLAAALDRRSAPRLALLLLGAVLARGRRTVTIWIRAAGLSGQFRSCYTAVAAAGKKAETVAAHLVLWVVKPLVGEFRTTPPSPPPKPIWVVVNSQCHESGGGDQTDPHVVKLGNGNVGDLREKPSRREGEGEGEGGGKKLKAKG